MKKITKAVILAAGLGTRFLPITKSVPKEMLPIVDTPTLDYLVTECVDSGIKDIMIIVSRGKNCIIDNYDRNYELESILHKSQKKEEIALINKYTDKVRFCFARQFEMQGTAKALQLAESFIGGEDFVLLFGDDLIYSDVPVVKQLLTAYENTGKTILGVMNLEPLEAIKYGVLVKGMEKGKYTEVLGIKEKPELSDLPSTLVSIGRFIFTNEIFDYIKDVKPSKSNEYYLTDAIALQSKGSGVFGYQYDGIRYDIGDKQGYLRANIEYALRDNSLREALAKYIKELSKKL